MAGSLFSKSFTTTVPMRADATSLLLVHCSGICVSLSEYCSGSGSVALLGRFLVCLRLILMVLGRAQVGRLVLVFVCCCCCCCCWLATWLAVFASPLDRRLRAFGTAVNTVVRAAIPIPMAPYGALLSLMSSRAFTAVSAICVVCVESGVATAEWLKRMHAMKRYVILADKYRCLAFGLDLGFGSGSFGFGFVWVWVVLVWFWFFGFRPFGRSRPHRYI
jgi:hypothetical protein